MVRAMSELKIFEVRLGDSAIWDAPELKGGVTLNGTGESPTKPGPHRSYSYTIHYSKFTGYQTIQTCEQIHNPISKRDQLVTITASQLNHRQGVDKLQDKIRNLERYLQNLPYDCRVLQSGDSIEIQCYLPCGVRNNDKCMVEEKILNLVRKM